MKFYEREDVVKHGITVGMALQEKITRTGILPTTEDVVDAILPVFKEFDKPHDAIMFVIQIFNTVVRTNFDYMRNSPSKQKATENGGSE